MNVLWLCVLALSGAVLDEVQVAFIHLNWPTQCSNTFKILLGLI